MDAASKKKVRSSDSHIHDDIAFSILSKLPFKSLTRFTCANKSWSLLFQNPNFMNTLRKNQENKAETRLLIKEHLPGFTIQQSLSILSGERFENRVNLEWPLALQQQCNNANANASASANPFPFTPPIIILGSASVNGTLCLYRGLTTVLWNPSTSEFKIIPPGFKPKEKIEFKLPPHGFGYDCVTDDYKVIRKVRYPFGCDWVCLPDKDDPFWETDVHNLDLNDAFWEEKGLIVKLYDYEPFWEIYSLRSDSWRKLDGFDDVPDYFPGITSMVNFNGFCHWLTLGPDNDIVSFNFSKETFFATTLPSSSSDVKHRSHMFALVELNESLSVIYNYEPDFHIWVLGEVGVNESWTKLFIVGPYNCSIVCLISVGNKNSIFFREQDSELGWFDLSTQRVEVIGVNGESFCSHMVIYKENLIPFPRNE